MNTYEKLNKTQTRILTKYFETPEENIIIPELIKEETRIRWLSQLTSIQHHA